MNSEAFDIQEWEANQKGRLWKEAVKHLLSHVVNNL